MNISELCLRRPVLATVLSIMIVIFGVAGLLRVPVRELPDVDTAEVTVSVNYIGAGPSVVDAEMTTVIEAAVAGIAGIDSISSEAKLGGSRSVIMFDTGRDIDQAAADVRAAVQAIAPRLPAEADKLRVEKNDSEGDPIIWMTMTSSRLNAAALTDYADRFVVDRLETVSGVASVNLYGERAYAMRIWLDPDAMAARGVSVNEIESALRDNNLELPSGQLETESRTDLLRTETRLNSAAAFEDLTIAERDGRRIRLGDVAEVALGVKNDDSLFRAGGTTAIGLGVLRQSRSNTMSISTGIAEAVAVIQQDLPEGTKSVVSSDDALFIRSSIIEVVKTLTIAVAIVVAVIFVFLASIRATIVPAVTIPVALLGACAGIALAGFSINTLTLFALILAIGLVVDDAIVVLENIQRRVEDGEDRFEAARAGARQVFFAVISTSVTLIAAFVPLSLLPGEVGRLFSEFGVTLAIAVAVSTFVALSLCPVLASHLLTRDTGQGWFGRAANRATVATSNGFRAVRTRTIRAPVLVLGLAAMLSGASWSLYQNLPSELTRSEDRGIFFVSINAPAGSNTAYTDVAVKRVEEILKPYRDDGTIKGMISLVGRWGEPARAFAVGILAPWDERTMGPRDILNEVRPAFGAITLASVRAFAPSGLGSGGRTAAGTGGQRAQLQSGRRVVGAA